ACCRRGIREDRDANRSMGNFHSVDRQEDWMTATMTFVPPAEPVARRPHIARALFWAIFCSLYFIIFYGFANRYPHDSDLAGQYIRTFYFEWEKKIPCIPAFIVPYMSIDLLFFFSFFLCADLRELRTHAKRILLAITVACVFFILCPLKYNFHRPTG